MLLQVARNHARCFWIQITDLVVNGVGLIFLSFLFLDLCCSLCKGKRDSVGDEILDVTFIPYIDVFHASAIWFLISHFQWRRGYHGPSGSVDNASHFMTNNKQMCSWWQFCGRSWCCPWKWFWTIVQNHFHRSLLETRLHWSCFLYDELLIYLVCCYMNHGKFAQNKNEWRKIMALVIHDPLEWTSQD